MSYTSESVLGEAASLKAVRELVELLAYKRVDDGLKIPDRKASYFWFDVTDYRSYVGVELDVYKSANRPVVVGTRSRAGRSYWDLVHQNRTLKLLRDFFDGTFATDAGRCRYERPEGPPPAPISSGCYLARWRFNNALIKPQIYLRQRGLDQPNARPEPTGFLPFDEMNPRLFSNNLVLPYLVAVWEDYFKASFTAMLRYSTTREAALKRANLTHARLEMIASGVDTVEKAVAESLSFQRPSVIANNFKLIDPKFDLAAVLRKRYRRRRESLFESIESLVEKRNAFVHTGTMDVEFTEPMLERSLKDFEVAVDRAYDAFGVLFDFTPIRYY